MDTVHPPTTSPHPAGTEHLRADVAVVGAGVIGLATAWELRRRGCSVVVVDPDPGAGASRAAAGMLAPVSEVQHRQDALVPLMRASAAAYPGFVAGLEAAAGASVGHRATETLVCAADPADRQALADLRELQLRHGMEVEALPVRAARALEPALSPRLAGAFRIPGDHQVDPRRLVAALLAALTAQDPPEGAPAGPVRIVHDRVTALRRGPSGAVTGVRLSRGGMVSAGGTLLAPGAALAAIDGLPAGARPPLRPVHGDILRARLPDGAPELLGRTVRGLVHGVPVYLVPRADRTLVIGATSREDDLAGASAGGVFRLLRDAQALVPGTADLELTEVLARARPGTPDDVPCLGPVRDPDGTPVPGLVLSTGYFRHGVLLTPLAARLAAQLLAGEPGPDPAADAELLTTTDPQRFATPSPTPRSPR
ncbi:glycine oxidase ThiO [Kocuria flava]|uniref:glycine oxidase n=1 Tax=Kocuria flava TaxID=446860 RepID=A0ABQ0X8F4_9MICC|nr:glycine oxidase ThiO [Kocuria flava]GEO93680.1 glycine oxidase ThiO [Kocuria flava]